MAEILPAPGRVLMCNEYPVSSKAERVLNAACVPPVSSASPVEPCGCGVMPDPFTLNESCSYGCLYCYVGESTLRTKKHNTTRSLPVVS